MSEPIETARNCLREALGALMEVSDQQQRVEEAKQIIEGLLDFPTSPSWLERARKFVSTES